MTVTRHYNFADLFELAADKVPDRITVIDKRRQITYRDLDERSTRFAHALLNAGVKAGDHVGVLATNCIEWVEAMLAVYKMRARVVNVSNQVPTIVFASFAVTLVESSHERWYELPHPDC